MKKIVIYTSPAKGHLYPIMDLACELNKQGHHVTVQTLNDQKKIVEKEGLNHLPISPKIEKITLEDYKESNPIAQIKVAFSTWMSRAVYEIEDLERTVHAIQPDLLIIDVNTWGAATFAESLGKPWVMFLPYCLTLASPETPAFGPGFSPPKHILHRLRDKLVNKLVQKAIHPSIDQLNRLRNEYELALFQKYEDIYFKPDLLLYRTAEPFDYPRKNLPQHILPIGPGLWAPEQEEPEWIDDLPRPRIMISVSTEKQNDGKIIETALQALNQENYSLIITAGALNPENFVKSGKHTHITRFLSHASIINKIDLLVTHGGMGSTQRALAAGVPVCVIPFGRDQRETARRVEISNSGTMLPFNKLTVKRLKKAVEEALSKKDGAKKIAMAFQNLDGVHRGIDAINTILKKSSNKSESLQSDYSLRNN